jgi:hypothetical protein
LPGKTSVRRDTLLMAILDATRGGADTGRAMARANVNAVRGIYDAVARRDSVSPFEVYAEYIDQGQMVDDRQQALKAVGLWE